MDSESLIYEQPLLFIDFWLQAPSLWIGRVSVLRIYIIRLVRGGFHVRVSPSLF